MGQPWPPAAAVSPAVPTTAMVPAVPVGGNDAGSAVAVVGSAGAMMVVQPPDENMYRITGAMLSAQLLQRPLLVSTLARLLHQWMWRSGA